MRPPPTVVRRWVIRPAWVPLAVALAAVFLAIALAGLVAAPLASRRRIPRLALLAAAYLLVDASIVVSCAFLWRPGAAARRDRAWVDAHARLMRWALASLVSASRLLLGFRVQVEQLPTAESLVGRPLLVLARHGGPGDSFAIAELLLSRCSRTPVVVAKESLRWDPGLDVLLSRLSACFLPPGGAGLDLLRQISQLARSVTDREAILLFPEGGNWTPDRHRTALARLWARGRGAAAARAAANPHVLPPRPGGVLACLAARPDLEVVVVAHTGLEDLVSPADVWRALPVGTRPLVTRWWHRPAAELPVDADLRQDWLEVQWAVIDSWIDARKAAGRQTPQDAAHPAAAWTAAAESADTMASAVADVLAPGVERTGSAGRGDDNLAKAARNLVGRAQPFGCRAWPLASGPIAGRPIASGPIAGRPIASGPLASGPIASGPIASGPIAGGPRPSVRRGMRQHGDGPAPQLAQHRSSGHQDHSSHQRDHTSDLGGDHDGRDPDRVAKDDHAEHDPGGRLGRADGRQRGMQLRSTERALHQPQANQARADQAVPRPAGQQRGERPGVHHQHGLPGERVRDAEDQPGGRAGQRGPGLTGAEPSGLHERGGDRSDGGRREPASRRRKRPGGRVGRVPCHRQGRNAPGEDYGADHLGGP